MKFSAPWRTVRGRLLLAALFVEMCMLAILVGNSLRLLHDAMGDQAREQAEQIAPVLSAALVAPLAQYDYATVQAVLDESHAIRGIDYLAVTDANGAIVATSGWPNNKPLPAVDAQFSLDDDDAPPRYDVALPIKLAGQTMGHLQFGLDLSRIMTARQNLLSQGMLIAASELLLSAGVLALLGLLITRQLSVLTAASLQVAEGTLTLAPVPEGQDDVGRLGAAFNVMSRAIAERVEQLTTENQMRLKAQQELEEALERIQDRTEQLNAIFDLSPDGFVSFDQHRRVKYASPAFLGLLSFSMDQIQGLNEAELEELLIKRCVDRAPFPGFRWLKAQVTPLPPSADAPGSNQRSTMELGSPQSTVLEVNLRISNTDTVSQILYVRDITHETEVDRMKSEFLSHAAHELRTPMSSIYGFSEMLKIRELPREKSQEIISIIHRQSELMISIINELLDLVRIEERKGQDFVISEMSLDALVSQVVGDFGTPKGRTAPSLQVSDKDLIVRADAKKLMQVLRNVISNAYKYSPNGGAVHLEVFRMGGDASEETWAGVRISDEGIGMTREQVERVFDRFYRADTSGAIPGTGLGMSLVKEILEILGGRVDIESQLGLGTTVTVWMPVARASSGTGHSQNTDPHP